MIELERELTEEELYQRTIKEEFERLKNLPREETIFTDEQIAKMEQLAKINQRISEIKVRLQQLSQDLIQVQAGALIDDLESRKAEFQTLHNELRVLEGKEPREYIS